MTYFFIFFDHLLKKSGSPLNLQPRNISKLSPYMQIKDPSWNQLLQTEFCKPYMKSIQQLLEESTERPVYPPKEQIFKALDLCPFTEVKVVILGQDPYHNPGEAMGLSFSVPQHKKVPPSLKNIFKEIHTDIGIPPSNHGDLSSWAKQGVLLLNAILTVEHKKPASHRKWGWQEFTDHCIQTISNELEHVVFMLWGNFAQTKAELIDTKKHLVLQAKHPSPLARGAFFGCKHFSKANAYLKEQSKKEIDWSLPSNQLF